MPLLPTRASLVLLVGMLAGVGTLHLVHPRPFDALIPEALGHRRAWIYASGAAEIAGAALLAHPRTRRLGGWWAAALLVGVFPGNVKAALDGGMRGAPAPLDAAAVAWFRLPLQLPLVAWALRHGRGRPLRRSGAQGRQPTQPASTR